MTADIFTKALPQPAFIKHNLNLGLVDHSAFMLQENTTTGTPISEDGVDYEREDTLGRSPGEGWYF